MRGWKTWAAAVGAFATGVSMVASGLTADVMDVNQIWAGILTCAGALGLVGIGHKLEKNG